MTTAAQRDAAIKALQDGLAKETADRIKADAALSGRIDGTNALVASQQDAIDDLKARVAKLEGSVVTPPPVDPPPPTGDPAFLSRPASAPIVKDGGTSVLIENVSIQGGGVNSPSSIGITVKNVSGTITIRDVDLANLIGGIYLYNCSGVLDISYRSRNIGDGTIGAGHSNHIQLAECSFAGRIHDCKFLGGRTEDMLSIWHSGGKGTGQELVVENNHLEGRRTDDATVRAWTRTSGTGIIISDGAGSPKNGNVIVRNNTLLTPGQVCIQIIDGPNLQITGNTILAEPYALNNNPMTTWEGSPKAAVNGNKWFMTKGDGSHPNPWLQGGTNPQITGTVGVADPTLKASDLRVVL